MKKKIKKLLLPNYNEIKFLRELKKKRNTGNRQKI